ncbi:MAG: class I poly(R)-hydroxyalkanoic acid synthase, partial [Asticcacaulis sp.]
MPQARAKTPVTEAAAVPPRQKPSRSEPATASRPADAPRAQSSHPSGPIPGAFDADSMRNLEMLSLNIAKATMTAQSALAKTLFKTDPAPTAMNGAPNPDPFQVAPAMTEIMSSLAANPDKL